MKSQNLCRIFLYIQHQLSHSFRVLYHLAYLCFPAGDSSGKESASNVGDLALIPGLGRPPGQWNIPEEGNGYPLQYSGLENSINYIVHGVAKSQT